MNRSRRNELYYFLSPSLKVALEILGSGPSGLSLDELEKSLAGIVSRTEISMVLDELCDEGIVVGSVVQADKENRIQLVRKYRLGSEFESSEAPLGELNVPNTVGRSVSMTGGRPQAKANQGRFLSNENQEAGVLHPVPPKRLDFDEAHKMWRHSLEAANNIDKGKLLADFVEYLFRVSEGFSILKREHITPTDEIDLIVENNTLSPFWIQFGGIVFVECKNTILPVPAKQIRDFAAKVEKRWLKLGIFVTSSRFTGSYRTDALGEIRDVKLQKQIIIAHADRSDIEEMFQDRLDPKEFLKKIVLRSAIS